MQALSNPDHPASALVASYGKQRRSNERVIIDLAHGADEYRDVDA